MTMNGQKTLTENGNLVIWKEIKECVELSW